MAAYIVATVSIEDPERFAAYGKAIAGLSESFGGERVVAGPVAEILEGEGRVGERVVVSRFPDGLWRAGANYSVRNAGGGGPAHDRDPGFPTRKEALDHVLLHEVVHLLK
ncbi:MAG: DUF1330 domain-containing protein, partial [Pseudomonadota bacterium]